MLGPLEVHFAVVHLDSSAFSRKLFVGRCDGAMERERGSKLYAPPGLRPGNVVLTQQGESVSVETSRYI